LHLFLRLHFTVALEVVQPSKLWAELSRPRPYESGPASSILSPFLTLGNLDLPVTSFSHTCWNSPIQQVTGKDRVIGWNYILQ
jgi:hypothetical protein